MPASATLARQKTPCSRVCAPRVAARPERGGASGASFMPDSKTTDDRDASRPIDVEPCQSRAAEESAREQAPRDEEGLPFFFKRKIKLERTEPDYVRKCTAEARQALIRAQAAPGADEIAKLWDLRNGLTLYVVILGEIAAGRTIRYLEPLKPSVCMAAFLGHDRMLRILRRSGVDILRMRWMTLDVLFSAILGRRLALVRRLLSHDPELLADRHEWYGHAGSFCAGFGSLAILRFLRERGLDMRKVHRHPRMPPDKPGHWGSALLFAVENRRRALVDDLVAHEEFCPWEGLVFPDGGRNRSFFADAVRNRCYGVARIYLENGWLDRPKTEDEFWGLLRRTEAEFDFKAFRFLEKAFPEFNAKRLVRERADNCFVPAILRHCGASRREPSDMYDTSRWETIEEVCNCIQDWVAAKRSDMVRYMLDQVPEVLPLVWPEFVDPIRRAFAETSSDDRPCRRYLFRFARSMGLSLFPDDETRRFWQRKCNEPDPLDEPLTMDEVFPYDEGLDDGGPFAGYFHPKDIRDKLYRAISARGSAARHLMDDPKIRPNCDLSWNCPFFVRLGDETDWETYKGWLLRGMEVYWENCDDPGCFELGTTPSIVRHLLPELEHRPWVSRSYSGNTLVNAASAGDGAAIKQILDAGCPVNFSRQASGDEITPLRAALLNGRDTVARLLYARGGMNALNGIVLPVPKWIASPRPLNLAAIRRATGDATAAPILINAITPLPPQLSCERARWLKDAKGLNGNAVCLTPSAPDTIVFRFDGRLYALRRESVAMDEHAFEVAFEDMIHDLKRIGCEILIP